MSDSLEFFNIRKTNDQAKPSTLEDYIQSHYDKESNPDLYQYLNNKPTNANDQFLYDFVTKSEWKEHSDDELPTYKEIIEDKNEESIELIRAIDSCIEVDLDEDMQEIEQVLGWWAWEWVGGSFWIYVQLPIWRSRRGRGRR